MEKLFYTLEEAAARLGKTPDDVRKMAQSGQLAEFRDRDRLMFKKEQVDLLAGGGDDEIKLADSGELEPLTLASSGSAPGLKADAKEGTGISLLDLDSTDDADANAVTRITASPGALVDPGEDKKSASGSSGLLDLTREADDTSLGAGLLEDVYGSETVASQTVASTADPDAPAADAGALFESPAVGADAYEPAQPVGVMAVVEPYDGPWSGLLGGFAVGAAIALCLGILAVIASLVGTSGSLVNMLGQNYMAVIGGVAGLWLIAGAVGFFLGKRG
jgi:hypothetical protein